MRFLSPTDQKCAESSTYWQFFYYRPPSKFRFTHLGGIVKMFCQELDIYIYIYMTLLIIDMDLQPGIDCTTFHSFFLWKVWKKKFFKILKSWQVCDWLAKWIIMLRFMDLRWPRVFRRSNAGLVFMMGIPITRRVFFYIETEPQKSAICWFHCSVWVYLLNGFTVMGGLLLSLKQ